MVPIKRIINLLLWLTFTLGLIGFSLPFVCAGLSYAGINAVSSNVRFPLGTVSGFGVDKNGNIACFSGDHHRLQVFNNEGHFIKGWFVYGLFRVGQIKIDDNDRIHFVTSEDKEFIFDVNGNILGESKEDGIYEELYQTRFRVHKDDSGNFYKIHRKLRTHIVKTDSLRNTSVIVRDPFYLWIFSPLFPTLLFLFLPPLVFYIEKEWKKRSKRAKMMKDKEKE